MLFTINKTDIIEPTYNKHARYKIIDECIISDFYELIDSEIPFETFEESVNVELLFKDNDMNAETLIIHIDYDDELNNYYEVNYYGRLIDEIDITRIYDIEKIIN